MALSLDSITVGSATIQEEDSENYFNEVIERLKAQKALPRDSFPKQMPFFTFSSISRESQIKELFQDVSESDMYRSLIKNIISIPDEKNTEMISKRLSAMQVMGFAQVMLYKVLRCPDEACPNRPREVATHNQYKDYEYECPFYHHDKDKRRMVLPPKIEDEFNYKANYFEEGKRTSADKDKCAQNYFESLFHPLYYKMFRCKREYCNLSQQCPFYHSEEEKKTWDRVFSNYVRKDRISYVKDKQKYYEHANNNSVNSSNSETRPNRRNNEQYVNRSGRKQINPVTPTNSRQRQTNYKPRTPKYQGQGENQTSPTYRNCVDWKDNRGLRTNSERKFYDKENRNKNSGNIRKGSGESNENNSFPVNLDHLYDQREALSNIAC